MQAAAVHHAVSRRALLTTLYPAVVTLRCTAAQLHCCAAPGAAACDRQGAPQAEGD
jgi:hypothetical protein